MENVCSSKSTKKNCNRTVSKYRCCIVFFLIAVLAEIFLCNYQFFRTHGESEIDILNPDTGLGVAFSGLYAEGNEYMISDTYDVFIQVDNINRDIKNVYIGLSGFETDPVRGDEGVDIRVSMIDEGHTKFYSPGRAQTVCIDVDESKYISVRPMGELSSIQIHIQDYLDGTKLAIDSIVLNKPVPMNFSILRVAVMFGFMLLLYSVRPGSGVFNFIYDRGSRKQTAAACGVCLILSLMVISFTDNMTQYAEFGARDPYNMLAHEMKQGKVNLDDELSDLMGIAEAEDPYIPDARDGYSYNWDSAFYNGHYYVYYGVVPEILIYLPHYLITGKDLNIRWSIRIELLLIIWGGLMLYLEISKRFKPLPYILWVLMLAASLMGMYIVTLSKVPTFYYLPPAMAIAMTLWGLYFWLSSVRDDKEAASGTSYIPWRIALGSLCMALVLGCRPQMILGSILAVPVFMDYFINRDSRSFTARNTVTYLLCGGLPYVLVFIPLLYYNAIRFSGPFDFGAAYNLTAIDVTKVNSDFGKVIPGLFTYWFRLPRIAMVFPFIIGEEYITSYVGDVFSHGGFGGLITCNPLLFFMFSGINRRPWIKNTGTRVFIWLAMAVGVVITMLNVMMGGFMPRYLCDITPFFFAAALPVIFSLAGRYEGTETGKFLVSLLCYICIASCMYHYFTYYTLEDGSQFGTWDRDVFVRAAHFWQWWE